MKITIADIAAMAIIFLLCLIKTGLKFFVMIDPFTFRIRVRGTAKGYKHSHDYFTLKK